MPLGALGTVGMSNPSAQSWAGILFHREGHELPDVAVLSALSAHFYFPANQMRNISPHGACIPSGLCEGAFAQEGSVTHTGSPEKPGRAGACLGLPFTSRSAKLSPHFCRCTLCGGPGPGAFPGQRIPGPGHNYE